MILLYGKGIDSLFGVSSALNGVESTIFAEVKSAFTVLEFLGAILAYC